MTAFVALVPARYASTRLPGKALEDLGGKPMVVRVAERAVQAGASRVVVATDDARIRDAVAQHGVEVCLTRADHATGTDRLAEAAGRLALADDTIVVNVQGDEPLLAPELIAAVAKKPDLKLAISADKAAAAVVRAVERGRVRAIIPARWKFLDYVRLFGVHLDNMLMHSKRQRDLIRACDSV